MKIALTTDLHRGGSTNTHKVHGRMFKEMKEANPDVIIITGDLISNQQKQMRAAFKSYRTEFPDTPIGVVHGNHCYWDKCWYTGRFPYGKEKPTFANMEREHSELHEEFNIFYLQDAGWQYKDEVLFLGYDGWYDSANPETNDATHLPRFHQGVPIHTFMNYRAHKAMDKILLRAEEARIEMPDRKIVCVTHFNHLVDDESYRHMAGQTSHFEHIKEKFDYLFFGHTHHPYDEMHGNCRVINAGTNWTPMNSGYDAPRFVIIEI